MQLWEEERLGHSVRLSSEENIRQSSEETVLSYDFILLFLAFFAFAAANQALIPALPIFFTQLGSNERQVGVLVGVMGVAALVSRFFVGGILAKYSEKKVILFGTILFALTFPASFVFSDFWPLLIVRVFQGIAFACFHTAALANVINIVPIAHRGQGLAYFMLAPNFALATAAPSGMFLINKYGFIVFFLSCTGLALCCFFLAWNVNEQKTVIAVESSASASNAFVPEWKIVIPAIANFLQIFVYGALAAFIPLYALQRGVTNPGIFFAASAVAMIAGRLFGGKILDTYDKEKIILILLFTCVVAMVILSFSKTLPMFILVGLIWGIGSSFFMPACMAYAFEYAGSSDGSSVGTYQAFVDLGVALGPVIVGIFVPFTGYPIMFLCLAAVCFIDIVYFQLCVRKRGGTALKV